MLKRKRFLGFLFVVCLAGIALGGCSGLPFVSPTPTPRYAGMDDALAGLEKFPPEQDLTPPILHVDEWEPPVPVAGMITTAGLEDSPFVLPDGKTMYYFFTPSINVPAELQLQDGVTGIYVSYLTKQGWGKPEQVVLHDPGTVSLDGCEFVDSDVMWFCSARDGNYRSIDIWKANFEEGRWQNWENAGELLNVTYQVGELHISADGTAMYYHTDQLDGVGGKDIWVTRWDGTQWGPPENIAAVNSEVDEGWPYLSADGMTLWFTRWYQGTPAIFRSQQVDGEWGQPELVVSQFAGEPTLDEAGNLYFVHHYVVDGQIMEADIFVAYKKGN